RPRRRWRRRATRKGSVASCSRSARCRPTPRATSPRTSAAVRASILAMIELDEAELRVRAKRLRLVVSDVAGGLTDGGAYDSSQGEQMKRFALRDGMGVERLRDAGVETAFLTREQTPIVQARGQKLKIRHVWMGVRDKRARLTEVERDTGYRANEIAY